MIAAQPQGTVWTTQSVDPDLDQMMVRRQPVSQILKERGISLSTDVFIAELHKLGVRYRAVSPAGFPYEAGFFHVWFRMQSGKEWQIVHRSFHCALGFALATCLLKVVPGQQSLADFDPDQALEEARDREDMNTAADQTGTDDPDATDMTEIEDVPF